MARRKRFSHSAYEDFVTCGEKYRLKRVVKVPEIPNLAGIGGSAFHEWTEVYDGQLIGMCGGDTPEQVDLIFEAKLFEEEEKSGLAREDFRSFGRRTKEKPNGEDVDYWRDTLLPDLCQRYIEWRARSEWTIATDLPPDKNDNTCGIEYRIDYSVGHTTNVGYVDRVMVDQHGNLGAVDLKTWSRKRVTAQLPGYVVGLRSQGVNASWGAYYHARKGVADDPKFFTSWTPERLARLYHDAATAEMLGLYIPHPSDDCSSFCSVAAHCEFAL